MIRGRWIGRLSVIPLAVLWGVQALLSPWIKVHLQAICDFSNGS